VIVGDIATDPLWDDYRHLALGMGSGVLVHPILNFPRGDGNICALFHEPAAHSEQQVIEQMTHLAAVASKQARGRACAAVNPI
jgi:hypothetical protein